MAAELPTYADRLESLPECSEESSRGFLLETVDPLTGKFILHPPFQAEPIYIQINDSLRQGRQRQVSETIRRALANIPLDNLTVVERETIISLYGLDGTGLKSIRELSEQKETTQAAIYGRKKLALKKLGLYETDTALSKFSLRTPILRQPTDDELTIFANDHNIHYQNILRYFQARTGNFHTAEDLTSDVFVKALESTVNGNFNQREDIPRIVWLMRIAKNKLIRFLKSQ
ncbi:hypothetical protein HYZ70_01630, partial [Candidatus Curtissbacteria bacterium]|nr:hypothetical protein [Candidatus Curtissbacteria bacterium]